MGFQYYNVMNGWVNVLSSTAVDVWDSIFHLLSLSVMIVVLPPYLVQFLIAAWPSSQKKFKKLEMSYQQAFFFNHGFLATGNDDILQPVATIVRAWL